MLPRASTLLAVTTLAALLPRVAGAYHVKTSDAGLPLRWAPGVVTYHLDPEGGGPLASDEGAAAIDAAFGAWAAQPDSPVELTAGTPAPGGFGFDPAGDNHSVVRWEDEAWDYDSTALMLTFVSYGALDGAILDADILINAVDHAWTIGCGAPGAELFDLQSSLTHEAGHFLGLAHSPEHPEATMFPSAAPGTCSLRALSADDDAGFTYLYVAAALPPAAGDAAPGMGCAAGGRSAGGTALWLGLGLLLGAALRRRSPVRRAVTLVAMLAGLTAPGVAAHATVLQPLTVEDLARGADLVVQGRVTAVAARRAGRLIVTDATVTVGRCLRGPCGARVIVRSLGGEVDGVGLHVEGTWRPRLADEVVVFLRRQGPGWAPLGMRQGVFQLERRGATLVAVRDLRDVAVWRDRAPRAGVREEWPLAALVARVPWLKGARE